MKNSILYDDRLPPAYLANGDFKNDCTTLKEDGLKFCEDTAFWDVHDKQGVLTTRHVVLSCDPGRKQWNTVMGPLNDPKPHGALWVYTPSPLSNVKDTPPPRAQRIAFTNYPLGHDFHPLGVDIYPSRAGGPSNMYVVNHARARTVIEQFTISPLDPSTARHVRTISTWQFISPNALALTSPDSFYVTNDHLLTRRIPVIGHVVALLESVLAIPLGFVSHVTLNPVNSGSESHYSTSASTPIIKTHQLVYPFVSFPNGISLSPSGDEVALGSSSLNRLFILARDPATNALTTKTKIPTPYCVDNVRHTDGGSVIVAGHPHFPSLIKVSKGAELKAGSWVMEVKESSGKNLREEEDAFDTQAVLSAARKVRLGKEWEMTTLFQSNGSGFDSSSTGMVDPHSGLLFITGLYAENGMLVCRLKSDQEKV